MMMVIDTYQIFIDTVAWQRLTASFISSTKRFPHYDKLRTIFLKDITKGSKADGLGVKAKDVVKENQIIPCLEDKELHVSENLSSFYGVQESESSKRKRNEGDEVGDNCMESKVANHGSNAVNDTMSKVASQMKDLLRLTLDERLMAMYVIGRSEPLSVMFDQLDQEGKVRMAQMVAVVLASDDVDLFDLMVVGECGLAASCVDREVRSTGGGEWRE
ncbi:hypothetical protein Tco_1211176 [Tanacetum coccineum]